MSFNLQGSFLGDLARGRFNIDTDSFRLILLGSGYTWSYSHNRRDDLGANEIAAGNGYTTGGKAIILTDSVDAVTREAYLHLGAVVFTPGPVTGARYGAIVKWRGGAASDDELIGVYDWTQVVSNAASIPATSLILRR